MKPVCIWLSRWHTCTRRTCQQLPTQQLSLQDGNLVRPQLRHDQAANISVQYTSLSEAHAHFLCAVPSCLLVCLLAEWTPGAWLLRQDQAAHRYQFDFSTHSAGSSCICLVVCLLACLPACLQDGDLVPFYYDTMKQQTGFIAAWFNRTLCRLMLHLSCRVPPFLLACRTATWCLATMTRSSSKQTTL
jgi:hypothetical protein